MLVLYVIGFLLHGISLFQTKQYGAWLFFVDGQSHWSYDVPIIICLISFLIQHFYKSTDNFHKQTSTILPIILISMNLLALFMSYYNYSRYTITVTFTAQSMFISVAFVVIANLLKSLHEEDDEPFNF
ncbi:DUF2975 domain-containing protein [Entamoeba marina]